MGRELCKITLKYWFKLLVNCPSIIEAATGFTFVLFQFISVFSPAELFQSQYIMQQIQEAL